MNSKTLQRVPPRRLWTAVGSRSRGRVKEEFADRRNVTCRGRSHVFAATRARNKLVKLGPKEADARAELFFSRRLCFFITRKISLFTFTDPKLTFFPRLISKWKIKASAIEERKNSLFVYSLRGWNFEKFTKSRWEPLWIRGWKFVFKDRSNPRKRSWLVRDSTLNK